MIKIVEFIEEELSKYVIILLQKKLKLLIKVYYAIA